MSATDGASRNRLTVPTGAISVRQLGPTKEEAGAFAERLRKDGEARDCLSWSEQQAERIWRSRWLAFVEDENTGD